MEISRNLLITGNAVCYHESRKIIDEYKLSECMKTKNVKLVIFIPISHADAVRQSLGQSGAGKIGQYDFCSFSSRGIGRFRGNKHANPAIGEIEKYEAVEEERIEVVVPREILKEVIEKVKLAHPYEEVALDVYPVEHE